MLVLKHYILSDSSDRDSVFAVKNISKLEKTLGKKIGVNVNPKKKTAPGQSYLHYSPGIPLKTNIKKVGELEPGIGWYTWDWNDKAKELGIDAEPTEGVLAQEVLEVKPDAVVVKDGYYAVDYAKVLS